MNSLSHELAAHDRAAKSAALMLLCAPSVAHAANCEEAALSAARLLAQYAQHISKDRPKMAHVAWGAAFNALREMIASGDIAKDAPITSTDLKKLIAATAATFVSDEQERAGLIDGITGVYAFASSSPHHLSNPQSTWVGEASELSNAQEALAKGSRFAAEINTWNDIQRDAAKSTQKSRTYRRLESTERAALSFLNDAKDQLLGSMQPTDQDALADATELALAWSKLCAQTFLDGSHGLETARASMPKLVEFLTPQNEAQPNEFARDLAAQISPIWIGASTASENGQATKYAASILESLARISCAPKPEQLDFYGHFDHSRAMALALNAAAQRGAQIGPWACNHLIESSHATKLAQATATLATLISTTLSCREPQPSQLDAISTACIPWKALFDKTSSEYGPIGRKDWLAAGLSLVHDKLQPDTAVPPLPIFTRALAPAFDIFGTAKPDETPTHLASEILRHVESEARAQANSPRGAFANLNLELAGLIANEMARALALVERAELAADTPLKIRAQRARRL